MEKVKFLILGAGPTGLGAAYRLKELGEESFLILDFGDRPGGLASSFADAHGFTWDIGGHVLFSHYQYFDKLVDRALGEDAWLHHQRESWIWIEKRFVPYPMQNNIRYLPQDSMWKCLSGLIDLYRNNKLEPRNFREWILATFGQGIAELFMFPYNFKVWAHPLEMLQFGWIGERVAITNLRRVMENILFAKDDLSWGPNNTFRFPKRGGTGAIWQGVAKLVGEEKIRLRETVVKLHSGRQEVVTEGGRRYQYDTLISTFPIDRLTSMLEDCPVEVKDAAKMLRHSSSNIVGVGLRGAPPAQLNTKCWMYFPENDCPFYRATVFSNYSPRNVPEGKGHWSLMAEVSESEFKPVDRDTVVDGVIQGMVNTGLIQTRDDVVSTWFYRAAYGYPIPTLDRDRVLSLILPALERAGIYSRGRFGAWKYEVSNQDHSLMQGVELINRLVLGIPEVTLAFPEIANANWGRKL
jgi:protoporphyrinogen oxidase